MPQFRNSPLSLQDAVLAEPVPGVSHVPSATPLTRLNYFDGRFLRAEDLELEQRYVRGLVALSNQGGGAGVVHGLTVRRADGDRLAVDAGLAITAAGRVLYLPDATSVDVGDLVERAGARRSARAGAAGSADFEDCTIDTAPPPTQVGETTEFWVLVVGPADVLCGQDVVYGRLCEDACATDTEHAHRVDGLGFRLVPIALTLPTSSWFTSAHLRSRVASAWFADERRRHPDRISGAGLRGPDWCQGADGPAGAEVSLALVARSGSTTRFVDMWTARRERLEPPAMVHWQWRMRMRPLDVFLAQVFQFQCQLPEALEGPKAVPPGVVDRLRECLEEQETGGPSIGIDEMLVLLGDVVGGSSGFARTMRRGGTPKVGAPTTVAGGPPAGPGTVMAGGVVELPAAGWLPVTPGQAVEPQVAALLGSGVDLRFCAVRHDYPPEAFWEAQHLARIPLWEGLERPDTRPEVDVLVPDPEVEETIARRQATALATQARLSPVGERSVTLLSGVTRVHEQHGQLRIASATMGPLAGGQSARGTVEHVTSVLRGEPSDAQRRETEEHLRILDEGVEVRAIHDDAERFLEDVEASRPTFAIAEEHRRFVVVVIDLTVGGNPLDAEVGDQVPLTLSVVMAFPSAQSHSSTTDVFAQMQVTGIVPAPGGARTLTGTLRGTVSQDDGAPRSFSVRTTLSVAASDGTTKLTIKGILELGASENRAPVQLQVGWGGTPTRGTLALTVKAGRGAGGVVQAELVESAEVLLDGNGFHDRAETAIGTAAAILEDRGRAAELARFLLGRGPSVEPTRSLVPTHDWVLFHRRRPADCELEPPPQPPEPRPPAPTLDRVDLVVLRPESPEHAEELVAALRNGELSLEERVRRITSVEFLTDTGVMVTADTVVADAVDGAAGRLGPLAVGYLAPEAAHGPGRVAEFADAIEIAADDVTVIDATPTERGYPLADEVFVVIANPPEDDEPVTGTHTVYDATGRDVETLLDFVRKAVGSGASFEEIVKELELAELGRATFSGRTLVAHSLPTDRPSTSGEFYVVVASDEADLEQQLAEDRAAAIGGVIRRAVEVVVPLASRTQMPAPAWIVTRQVGDRLFPTNRPRR